MNKAKLTSLIFLFVCFSLSAQRAPVRFGDIPMEDMQMKSYDKDTAAVALVLADYGNSTINYNESTWFTIGFDRLRRVKIFRKDGLNYATMTINLYQAGDNEEKLLGLKAVTYNLENGKIISTKLKSDQIFRKKEDENLSSITFTLPAVKTGSVIEISYSINSTFLYHFQDWQFQEEIPSRWSEYRANIPEYFVYNKYSKGYVPFTVNENKKSTSIVNLTSSSSAISRGVVQPTIENHQVNCEMDNFRWAIADVPAFKKEPFMNNYQDYISQLKFELALTRFPNEQTHTYTKTWQDFNSQFLSSSDFGQMISGSGFLKKIVEEQLAGVTDPKEKVSKIYTYVKKEVRWNGDYGKYPTQSFRKTLDEHKGNDADINLLMISMLQKSGLEADPVLISTRNHGFVRTESPLSSQFNYVLCNLQIGEENILLDATDPSLPPSNLPQRCLNGEGFIISEKNPRWAPLTSTVKTRTVVYADLLFTDNGNLEGKVSFRHSGYNAQTARKNYYAKGEENYVKSLSTANKWDIKNSQIDNMDKVAETVNESHDVVISEQIQNSGQGYFFNPLFDKRIDENPFKAETRDYPVDFGNASEESFTVKIRVSDQFTFEEIPKSKILTLPDNAAKFVYNAVTQGNTLVVTSGLSINKSLFVQTEYPALREFYAQVVAKQNEQVVLKKR